MILSEVIQKIVIDDLASFVISAAMLVVTLVSVVCAILTYFNQRNRSKKDTANNLAAHYNSVILEKEKYISSVYNRAELFHVIKNTISLNEMEEFDRDELNKILDDKKIDFYSFKRRITEIDPVIILNCKIILTGNAAERESTYSGFVVTDGITGEQRVQNASILYMDFNQQIDDLLNQLEWFAMNCHYGLADETILFQPLHQSFLAMVWMLYPTICMKNDKTKGMFYTNVIWLFLKWRNRVGQIVEAAERKRRVLRNKAAKAQARADCAQSKVDAIKIEVFNGKNRK